MDVTVTGLRPTGFVKYSTLAIKLALVIASTRSDKPESQFPCPMVVESPRQLFGRACSSASVHQSSNPVLWPYVFALLLSIFSASKDETEG